MMGTSLFNLNEVLNLMLVQSRWSLEETSLPINFMELLTIRLSLSHWNDVFF